MTGQPNFEDGKKASTEIQKLILELMARGMDPKSIGLMACGIGSMMLIKHYGKQDGIQMCHGMVNAALDGDFQLYPGLNATNDVNS